MIAMLSLAGLGEFDREIEISPPPRQSTAVPAPTITFADQPIIGVAPPIVRAPLWPWLLAGGALAVAWYFWQDGGGRRSSGGPLG